jgi:hypothetical protein
MKLWLSVLMIAVWSSVGQAGEKTQDRNKDNSPQFLRLRCDENKQPIALESAIVRYVPKDPRKHAPIVDLVAAVHIGEKKYYEQLNREFEGYDAVLYELVAPEGTRIPKGGDTDSGSLISMVQKALKDVLELEFQLQIIDYTRPNLVHADLSPDEFTQSMEKRGESLFSMFLRMMSYAMAQQSKEGNNTKDFQLLFALFDKDRAMALKRIMAEQFQSMDGMLTALDGKDGSTLITERNKAAIQVLHKQIGEGKKKLAIFYGGGHMTDFDKRLRNEFGLVPIETRWLVAWDLRPRTEPLPVKKQP